MNVKKRNIKEFFPIGILSIIGFGSIIQVLLTNYTFDYRQYIGLSLLLISGIFFFTNRKVYKYFFGITLILGTLNFIAFSTYIIGINLIFIPIQIIPFVVLIIYSIIYINQIIELLVQLTQKSEKEEQEYYQRKLESFKMKFADLNDFEIDNKLNQDLVPEAKQALNEIKNERRKTHHNSGNRCTTP